MTDQTNELLQEIREDLKFIRDKVISHDTSIKDIIGNGQPGRLKILEEQVEELKELKWKLVGLVVGIVMLVEGSHIGFDKLFELVK